MAQACPSLDLPAGDLVEATIEGGRQLDYN